MPAQLTDQEVIVSAHNAVVKIALLGATAYSWTALGEERFFHSRTSPITGDKAVRGGIPICWPVFGPPPSSAPFDKLKQHGFARTQVWTYAGPTSNGNGAKFSLEPTDASKKIYSPDFKLLYTVEITDEASLSTDLRVHNSGSDPLSFQALFHTYFALIDSVTLDDVRLSPLAGLEYKDKVKQGEISTESKSAVGIDQETDRIYIDAPDDLRISYGGKGGVKLKKRNLPDVVYWSPGSEKGSTIGDLEPGGWLRFVCVEPGTATDFVELESGRTWEGGQTLTVELA